MRGLNSLILEGEITYLKDDMAIMEYKRYEKDGETVKERKFTFTVLNGMKDWSYLKDYAIPISARLVGRLESDENGLNSRVYIVAEHVEVSMKNRYIGKKTEEEEDHDNIEHVGEKSDNVSF